MGLFSNSLPSYLGADQENDIGCENCRGATNNDIHIPGKFCLPCRHWVCVDCLTIAWFNQRSSEHPRPIVCPVDDCNRNAGFPLEQPMESISVESEAIEGAGRLRKDSENDFNVIAVDCKEARYLFQKLYNISSPEGSDLLPQRLVEEGAGAPDGSENPFFAAIDGTFADVKENILMVSPDDLEYSLREPLSRAFLDYALKYYRHILLADQDFQQANFHNSIDLGVAFAVDILPQAEFKDYLDTWESYMNTLVDLLTVRHLNRFWTDDFDEVEVDPDWDAGEEDEQSQDTQKPVSCEPEFDELMGAMRTLSTVKDGDIAMVQ